MLLLPLLLIIQVRVEVKDTTINMNRGESSGGGIMLCMKLPSCTFRDETMEHEYSSPPSVYKRISIAPLSISLATEGGPVVEICRTEGLCTVRLRFCQDVTPLMEVNVGLCQVSECISITVRDIFFCCLSEFERMW